MAVEGAGNEGGSAPCVSSGSRAEELELEYGVEASAVLADAVGDPALVIGSFADVSRVTADAWSGIVVVVEVFRAKIVLVGGLVVVKTVSRLAGAVTKSVLTTALFVAISEAEA